MNIAGISIAGIAKTDVAKTVPPTRAALKKTVRSTQKDYTLQIRSGSNKISKLSVE